MDFTARAHAIEKIAFKRDLGAGASLLAELISSNGAAYDDIVSSARDVGSYVSGGGDRGISLADIGNTYSNRFKNKMSATAQSAAKALGPSYAKMLAVLGGIGALGAGAAYLSGQDKSGVQRVVSAIRDWADRKRKGLVNLYNA